MGDGYDFSGWATRNDLKCSDGRTIRKDAFKHNDGTVVPLVWNHNHNSSDQVLGHALLENRAEGVYAYGYLNPTENAQNVKLMIQHGDVKSLSIYANHLKQDGGDVLHGDIRELSLVLAGANPGAYIDNVIMHGDDSEDGVIIYTDEELVIEHGDSDKSEKTKEEDDVATKSKEKTVEDVFNELTEEQKNVVYAIIGAALEENNDNDNDEEEDDDDETNNNKKGADMKHNIFEGDNTPDDVLSHSEIQAIVSDAKRYGSLKDSVLAHGITNVEYLFPDATNIDDRPGFIQRDMGWVSIVMNNTHHTPFSRIKSMFANITEDDARAKGYIKGNKKKDEVFSLLKRTTTPTTIYKKQKMDRDDVVDITDFDVVAWLKSEMRMMLDEEIARAILVGDGRLSSSDDKINETNIRPIWKDEDLYTIKAAVETDTDASVNAKNFIKAAIKSRKLYKGSGNPSMFITEDLLTDCLLLEDTTGRIIYDSITKLATALRVKEIITVPVMENQKRTDDSDGKEHTLGAIIVNLTDYNVGADKGGAVNMFDDFDIDYNQQKYLIETRCSGALVKPYSAIAVEFVPGE